MPVQRMTRPAFMALLLGTSLIPASGAQDHGPTMQPIVALVALDEPQSSPGEVPQEVELRGQKMAVYPPAKLREKGMEVRELPPDQNAAWLYIQAYNARVALPDDLNDAQNDAIKGQWPQGQTGQRLQQWLDQNKSALELTRRAAGMKDCAMPMFQSSESDALWAVLLPTLAEHRQLVRLLAVDAAWQASRGDAVTPLNNAVTMQQMANHAGNGHTMIEHLVGVACQELATQSVSRAAAMPGVDAEALRHAMSELEALHNAFPGWERALQNEERLTASTLEDMYRSPASIVSGPQSMPGASDGNDGWARLGRRLWNLCMPDRASRRNLKIFYDRMAKSAQPAGQGQPARFTPSQDELLASVPAWDVPVRILIPSLERSFELTTRAAGNGQRARLTLAVEAFKRVHGRAPQSLSQLVPEFIKEIPTDPLTGNAYVYSPTGAQTGLELVGRKEPGESMPTPGEAGDRSASAQKPSEWRRHVDDFCDRHELSASQRTAALGILADLEKRAAPLRARSQDRVAGLKEQLARTGDATARQKLADQLAAESRPLDQLFKELNRRLDSLLTERQRRGG